MSPATSRSLSVTVAGLLLAAFGTPLSVLWAAPGAPVWVVYALWAAAIVALSVLAARTRGMRDGDEEPPTT